MDFLPQERERGITISSAAISFKWKNYDINLIDTPGHVDFTIEVERSMRVLDGAVIVIDAVAGVQAQTRTVWKQAKKHNVAAIAFVNKMDRQGSSFDYAVKSLKDKLEANPISIQIPIMETSDSNDIVFGGVVDLIGMRSIVWSKSNDSRVPPLPSINCLKKGNVLYDTAKKYREQMLDSIAGVDDIFMTEYLTMLETEESLDFMDENLIVQALRRACLSGHAVPILCGTSLNGKGVEPLLNAVGSFLPSPEDRKASLIKHKKTEHSIALDSKNVKDLCALAFKVVHDKSRGLLVYARSYSGTLSAKNMLYNTTKGVKERPNHLLAVQADDLKIVDSMPPGSIGCFVGLKSTSTGDTLVTYKGQLEDYELDGLRIPDAVFSLAIEPETSLQQDDMIAALKILEIEDPSLRVRIDSESGQTIIGGIGELHLEIVCDKLKRTFGIEVQTGKAYISYRETLYNKEDEITRDYVYDRMLGNKQVFAKMKVKLSYNHDYDGNSKGGSSEDISRLSCCIVVEPHVRKLLSGEEYHMLMEGVRSTLSSGPSGYPLVGLKIEVMDLVRNADTTTGSIRACASILIDSMLKDIDRTLLEPVMNLEVELPDGFVGTVLSDLSVRRRALIGDILPANVGFSTITAIAPLGNMMGYASNLRSATQGQGVFSMEYLEHQPIDQATINQEMQS